MRSDGAGDCRRDVHIPRDDMSRARPAFLTLLWLHGAGGRSRRTGGRNGILSRGGDAAPTGRELGRLPWGLPWPYTAWQTPWRKGTSQDCRAEQLCNPPPQAGLRAHSRGRRLRWPCTAQIGGAVPARRGSRTRMRTIEVAEPWPPRSGVGLFAPGDRPGPPAGSGSLSAGGAVEVPGGPSRRDGGRSRRKPMRANG